jgi:DNA-binding Lrp family transcriptional regulator
MEDTKVLSTIEEVKAISDPFKFRILRSFYNIEKPASVKQIADSLNEGPSKVHYHVKNMEKLGILELVYTKEINGIIAKFYEPTARDFEVKCSDDIDIASKAILLGETQIMLAKIYDASKETFLEELSQTAKTNEKTKGGLSMTDLYLTETQAEEFSKYIEDFFKKNKIHDENIDNTSKYHCFVSFLKLSTEDHNKTNYKCDIS